MSRFKVGDKVEIVNCGHNQPTWVYEMNYYIGDSFYLKEENFGKDGAISYNGWWFGEDCFKLVNRKEPNYKKYEKLKICLKNLK
jgi:hypothetical protein